MCKPFQKIGKWIKYLLTVIDVFPQFVWIKTIKQRTAQEVANAFSKRFKDHRPSKMWVDKGCKFYNKDVWKLVELYSSEN